MEFSLCFAFLSTLQKEYKIKNKKLFLYFLGTFAPNNNKEAEKYEKSLSFFIPTYYHPFVGIVCEKDTFLVKHLYTSFLKNICYMSVHPSKCEVNILRSHTEIKT